MRVSRLPRTIQVLALALALAPSGAGATIYNFTGKATKLGPVPDAPENQQNSVISIGGQFTVTSTPGDLRAYQLRLDKVLFSEGLAGAGLPAELLLDPGPKVLCPDVRRSRPGNAVYVLSPGGSARPTARATVSIQSDGSMKFRLHMNRALIASCDDGSCAVAGTQTVAPITTAFQLVPRTIACGAPLVGGAPLAAQSITVDWKKLVEVDGTRLRYTGGDGAGPSNASLPKAHVTVDDTALGGGLYQVLLNASGSSSTEPVLAYSYSIVERDTGVVVLPPTGSALPTFEYTMSEPGDYVAIVNVLDITGQLSNPARRGFRLH